MGRITDHRNALRVDIAGMREPLPNETADHSLHVCPECGSTLVQPTSWEQQGDRTLWRVWRRCPECEWTSEGLHSEVEIDAFDAQLDLGSHELADQLRTLEHANMREMADAFITALDGDLIGADDFA
jgi:predicted RNA-binding Zn-ribbon protein involved in translation (DUF1610 family)